MYPRVRGLVGVVHLAPMPGDPSFRGGGFDDVFRRAREDGEALAKGGCDAILVENFGSAPFAKGDATARVPPHQAAAMALVTRALAAATGLPIGVNCLRNDAMTALGIAAASGAAFVRVNVHVGAYVTDQGWIEGEADRSLRYRAALGANVAIVADVLVKHAAPLVPITPEDATRDTLERGLADAIVVTGKATGAAIDEDVLARCRKAAGDAVVLAGSGMTPEMASRVGPLLDGAIVGTWLKERGDVRAPVDVARVREMKAALRAALRRNVG